MSEQEQRLFDLAREYLNYISLMTLPDIGEYDYQYLSSQRSIVHDELIDLTGLARPFDMIGYCQNLITGRARPIFK